MFEELPAGLPVPLTSLIGRRRETAEVCALLSQKGVRLVTLSGPGGVGKTRLSIAVVARLADQNSIRTTFIDLAPVHDPALVLTTIAQRLDVQTIGSSTPKDLVIARFRESPWLLLIDNFEHVISAAPLLAELLATCPELQMVVTSRAALRISPEHEFEVTPLSVPSDGLATPEELLKFDAVRLFVERAAAVRQGFDLDESNAAAVAGISRALDGLPLAVELSAARLKALTEPELLARLSEDISLLSGGGPDRPSRQRTMRDAIGWSYNLLSGSEQRLLQQISLFAAGCSLEAIEAVSIEHDTLELLLSLVDKSLVRLDAQDESHARYRMLETIRQYSGDLLRKSESYEDVRLRHAEYFLRLAESRNPAIPIPGDFSWIERISPDQNNLRLALMTFADLEKHRELLRLSVALFDFWLVRGPAEEGAEWLRRALAVNPAAPPSILADAFSALGTLAWCQGHYADAAESYNLGMKFARVTGNDLLVSVALIDQSMLAYRTGDLDLAADHAYAAKDILLRIGSQVPAAAPRSGLVLSILGDIEIVRGRLDRATEHFELAVSYIHQTAYYEWLLSDSLGGLGASRLANGDIGGSITAYTEGLQVSLKNKNAHHAASNLAGLACLAAFDGQFERASVLLGASEEARRRCHGVVYPRDESILEVCHEALMSHLDGVTLEHLKEKGNSLSKDDILEEVKRMLSISQTSSGRESHRSKNQFSLSRRELEVLQLIAKGSTDSEIANQLCISRRTVTTHTSSIFAKLGVSGRTEAAALAIRRDLV